MGIVFADYYDGSMDEEEGEASDSNTSGEDFEDFREEWYEDVGDFVSNRSE